MSCLVALIASCSDNAKIIRVNRAESVNVTKFKTELKQLEQSIMFNEALKTLNDLRPELETKLDELQQAKSDYQLKLAKTNKELFLAATSLQAIRQYNRMASNQQELSENDLTSLLEQVKLIEEFLKSSNK